MARVRSPPLPRVPVSTARWLVVGTSASMALSSPAARRQIPSQSASSAERVEVIARLMLSDVSMALDELLPAQQEAVTHADGPLLIRGAAGTGKTVALLQRFRWLVAEGCRPERIAVVTPSPGRGDRMRSWLEDELRQGYEELFVLEPVRLAALAVNASGPGSDALDAVLDPSERFAMLLERVDELSLQSHDFGGSARALLTGFIRRIDRLKAHLIDAERYARWATALSETVADPAGGAAEAALEQEFAEVYRAHERMLSEAGMGDAGDLISDAIRLLAERPSLAEQFDHLLVDDA